jgi:hypothetical protein
MAVVAACASDKPGRTKLPDGSYQLKCRMPLADCLTALADVCKLHGYDVLKGKETISRNGVEPVDSTIIESDATVRCRTASTLFGSEASAAASGQPAGVAPVSSSCFPGTTQACLGPAACKGAQTCGADGSSFGPCDCGASATPLAATPEGDAGPPPTWAVPAADAGAP